MNSEPTGHASSPEPNEDQTIVTPVPPTQDNLTAVKEKAGVITDQARQVMRDPENAGRLKVGGAAVAAAGALALLTWAIRRRRSQPKTRWEQAMHTTRHTSRQAKELGAQYVAQARDAQAVQATRRSAQKAAKLAAEQAAEQGRQLAAAASEPAARRISGVALLLTVVVAVASYLTGRRTGGSS